MGRPTLDMKGVIRHGVMCTGRDTRDPKSVYVQCTADGCVRAMRVHYSNWHNGTCRKLCDQHKQLKLAIATQRNALPLPGAITAANEPDRVEAFEDRWSLECADQLAHRRLREKHGLKWGGYKYQGVLFRLDAVIRLDSMKDRAYSWGCMCMLCGTYKRMWMKQMMYGGIRVHGCNCMAPHQRRWLQDHWVTLTQKLDMSDAMVVLKFAIAIARQWGNTANEAWARRMYATVQQREREMERDLEAKDVNPHRLVEAVGDMSLEQLEPVTMTPQERADAAWFAVIQSGGTETEAAMAKMRVLGLDV
jgi:hypothetical protein